jgi:hypothetical protein
MRTYLSDSILSHGDKSVVSLLAERRRSFTALTFARMHLNTCVVDCAYDLAIIMPVFILLWSFIMCFSQLNVCYK